MTLKWKPLELLGGHLMEHRQKKNQSLINQDLNFFFKFKLIYIPAVLEDNMLTLQTVLFD